MRPQSISEWISGSDKPAANCPWAGFPLPAVPSNLSPDFATALIAAKPQKPCDGGVFWVLNLPSKKVKGTKAGLDWAGRDGLLAVAVAGAVAVVVVVVVVVAVVGAGAGAGRGRDKTSLAPRPQATSERISRQRQTRCNLPVGWFVAVSRTPNPSPDFATALIAAKPLKPCDGGVFWASNLLSKKE